MRARSQPPSQSKALLKYIFFTYKLPQDFGFGGEMTRMSIYGPFSFAGCKLRVRLVQFDVATWVGDDADDVIVVREGLRDVSDEAVVSHTI